MLPLLQLACLFEQYPAIIENTLDIMESCSIDFDFKVSKNKSTYSKTKEDDRLLLEKLAYEGMVYRYGKNNPLARQRVAHELEIIHNLGFSSYFLVAWDVIHYTLSRGFYHVGRGSGANSIVAYCLRITDVDPIKLDLYFERFLNPKRTTPPDFDIDFSWKDRDEVQDYIFKRYGKKHAVLLGATSTFKEKSITRELAKVYGLPKEEIDLLVNDPFNPYNNNEVAKLIMSLGEEIE
jgi:DNA polymerase-3 subunit alpha